MNISILICVHSSNAGYDALLRRALTSLAAQTFKDFQTVIVLDECWDGTLGVISEFQNILHIDCLERLSKQGLAKAKNAGIELCTGDWIGFLDADDAFECSKLEQQIKYIIEHPEIDIIGTQSWDVYNVGTDQEFIKDNCFFIGQYETDEQIKNRLPFENPICHASVLIKRNVLLSLGGYDVGQYCLGREDYCLWKKAAAVGYVFYNIPKRLYYYSMNTSVPR